MVQVRQIAEMGAYVKLLEYDGVEGMILLSELSRRRIRSIQKLIRVGRNEVVVVLRVDKEKGYIDLSKRRVSPEDVLKCEERFNKSKAVNSIMAHVSGKLSIDIEKLYQDIAWPLHRKYGHSYDAFKLSISEPDMIFGELNIDEQVLHELKQNISRRLTPQPVKIRSDLEVTCFGYEGIDAVKNALKAGESLQTENIPVKIKLVAPPLYVISTTSTDKQGALSLLENVVQTITDTIKKSDGDVNIKMKPKAVTDTEDSELQALMERVERENKEVSGDEEESD